MFFLYDIHPFYTLFSEIDLRMNPHLRLLQFNLWLYRKREDQRDDVVQWFNSICESVVSRSLVVEVCERTEEDGICNKIQDALLALNARVETLSVHLPVQYGSDKTINTRRLFPKLYEKGIVIERPIAYAEVCCYFLTSKLPY